MENPVKPEDIAEKASNHLLEAWHACWQAERMLWINDNVKAALHAQTAYEEAARAKRLIFNQFLKEYADTPPTPSEEQRAEWKREAVLIEAAEELLEACEEAREYIATLSDKHGRTMHGRLTEAIYGRLTEVIEKARPESE